MVQGRFADGGGAAGFALLFDGADVFLFVTVDAQQFPVAAVGRVVVVVVVAVVDGQFAQFLAFEFAAAAAADMGKQFEGLFAVAVLAFEGVAAGFGQNLVGGAHVQLLGGWRAQWGRKRLPECGGVSILPCHDPFGKRLKRADFKENHPMNRRLRSALAGLVLLALLTLVGCFEQEAPPLTAAGDLGEADVLGRAGSLGLQRYVLQGPPVVLGPAVRNASGLAYNAVSGTLFVVMNQPARLLEVALDGTLLRQIELDGFEDTEGVVWLGGERFALIEERRRLLNLLVVPPGASRIAYVDARRYLVDATEAGNKGLEGVGWDAARAHFHLAKEKRPRQLYRLQLPAQEGGSVRIDSPWDVQRYGLGLKDLSDLYHCDRTGNLLLLSDESHAVVEVDEHGRERSRLWLKKGHAGLDHSIKQAEGLVLDGRGTLYICSEPNLLYIFAPAAADKRLKNSL